ncbi:endoglucanase [Algimonas arctica]|uniref:Endoglucanase n=1 Tax=Algimonas arctica TaxID=1479486 RepID=A0A8J3G0W3_9PROT|nr:glycoside hydrolase family 9 protein [Algimonas arctica]GHA81350.1 endoglucanase [Algimonas arctica]
MRLILSIIICLSFAVTARATDPAPFIVVDQFGYVPNLEKRAVIRDPQIGFDASRSFQPSGLYAVIDVRTGDPVYRGRPVAWKQGKVDEASGDRVWWFDFSALTTPGTYVVRDLDSRVESDPFEISRTVYRPVLRDAFKVFYYQRAGFEKRAPYAAQGYEDAASHLGKGQDSQAQRYDSKGKMDAARDLHGGWYDAGDYNQYTSWTANYVSSLLASYIQNPVVWTDDMGIPESGNGIPDVLDEVKWGLDWLARMQNTDGSMLSILARAEASPPSQAKGPSLYGLENTSATITAAGAFAMAAEIFRTQPRLIEIADSYQARSLRAWAWADDNPSEMFYNNDDDQGTLGLGAGQQEVDADRLDKKRLIAAAQIFAATGEERFCKTAERLYRRVGGIKSDTANGFEGDLGFTMLRFAATQGVPKRLSQRIRQDYSSAMLEWNGWGAVNDDADPYGAYVDGYWWGSNGTKARRGAVFTQAVVGGIDPASHGRAVNAASHYLHYLHGVNPMGLVYLSNMKEAGAERSVSTIYHAWFKDGSRDFDSTKTSRYGPAPGFLVGGPNPGYARDECCAKGCGGFGDKVCRRPDSVPPVGQPAAKSYGEFNDGWPLNSWSVTENSLGYQADYLRLLSKFVQ